MLVATIVGIQVLADAVAGDVEVRIEKNRLERATRIQIVDPNADFRRERVGELGRRGR